MIIFSLVELLECCCVTCWRCCGQDGNSILFRSKKEVEKLVLPVYFNHNNFRSLARQLNSYCFIKVGRDMRPLTVCVPTGPDQGAK